MIRPPPRSTLFPSPPLFLSRDPIRKTRDALFDPALAQDLREPLQAQKPRSTPRPATADDQQGVRLEEPPFYHPDGELLGVENPAFSGDLLQARHPAEGLRPARPALDEDQAGPDRRRGRWRRRRQGLSQLALDGKGVVEGLAEMCKQAGHTVLLEPF